MIYVYRAKGTDLYKIGYTSRKASDRVKEWQAGCPYELFLVGTIEGTLAEEKALHSRLRRLGCWKSDAAGQEWFELSSDKVEKILGHKPNDPLDPVLDFALQVGEDVLKKNIKKLSRRKGLPGVAGSNANALLKKI